MLCEVSTITHFLFHFTQVKFTTLVLGTKMLSRGQNCFVPLCPGQNNFVLVVYFARLGTGLQLS